MIYSRIYTELFKNSEKIDGGSQIRSKDGAPVPGATKFRESQDLSTLTVKELRALAADKGIEVPSEAKKAELVAALS